ncbi:extracellular solute-binding protein [Saccharothrix sp. S26]|uniref:sugar ABC transporter substrate-binding protein n=1 Tax=Saccharothrix sp. S26 TaxID=2907215 RepID=UPI001F225B2D|nr:extracellular solute-binding protein [Saccharothrix sp. S26]MCE6998540.1 extracellular solute-binding protein [Saccharothrix sp. S26]
MWTHSAGNPGEIAVYEQLISDFNASQTRYEVVQEDFPQGSYNEAVTTAAAARKLPCLLDMDGPVMPNWAWAGYLQPLGLPDDLVNSLLPTTVGRYKATVYSAGYWEAALAIFARKSVLDKNNIRIPTVDRPWTLDEFDAAVATLKASGYRTPLDLGAADKGEWWSYAYSPMLQSTGGDLVDRASMKTAEGALNGPDAVKFFTWFQQAFEKGWADNAGPIGNQRFIDDAVALSYTGVWNAKAALDSVGDDLLILPPVDFGKGPKIGGGSWQWGISAGCKNVDGAREYLEFSFQDKYLTAFADSQVVIPSTAAAAKASKYFSDNADLREFAVLSQKFALARPATPGYPVISSSFEKAAKDIMSGAEVKSTLDAAVRAIDADIASQNGYGF